MIASGCSEVDESMDEDLTGEDSHCDGGGRW